MLRDLLRPWRDARTWRALVHNLTSLPLGIALFVPTVVLLATTVGLLVIFPAAIVTLALLIFGTGAAAAIERSRHSALLDAELRNPVPPPRPAHHGGSSRSGCARRRAGKKSPMTSCCSRSVCCLSL